MRCAATWPPLVPLVPLSVPRRCCTGPLAAADAMAEALGVADLHRGLRGSLLGDTPPEASVQRTRGLLRAALRTAWSQEALRWGALSQRQTPCQP